MNNENHYAFTFYINYFTLDNMVIVLERFLLDLLDIMLNPSWVAVALFSLF